MPGRRYAVGELFQPDCQSYPNGMSKFGMGTLAVFVSGPTREEILAFRRGAMRLGVAEAGGCLFVLYTIGHMTGDAPYESRLTPEDERLDLESVTPRSQLLVYAFLVDADTGIISAMRQITMSGRVTRALVDAIRRQSNAGTFCQDEYNARLARAYARWDFNALVRIGTMDLAGGDASVEVLIGRWSPVEGG